MENCSENTVRIISTKVKINSLVFLCLNICFFACTTKQPQLKPKPNEEPRPLARSRSGSLTMEEGVRLFRKNLDSMRCLPNTKYSQLETLRLSFPFEFKVHSYSIRYFEGIKLGYDGT